MPISVRTLLKDDITTEAADAMKGDKGQFAHAQCIKSRDITLLVNKEDDRKFSTGTRKLDGIYITVSVEESRSGETN
jgi:hypothetical protein